MTCPEIRLTASATVFAGAATELRSETNHFLAKGSAHHQLYLLQHSPHSDLAHVYPWCPPHVASGLMRDSTITLQAREKLIKRDIRITTNYMRSNLETVY
jgi:hypothetical protein